MENKTKIIKDFETEQLESFNNNDKVKMLERLCSKLGLELKTEIDYLQNFNPKECEKRKLIHSGHLFFEVLCDGHAVAVNNDDFGSLGWSEVITILNTNGAYELLKWDTEYPVTRTYEVPNELLSEVNRTIEFLQNFNSKNELISFLEKSRWPKMTEKKVKNALDFLCEKYGLRYTFFEYGNYLGTHLSINTYSYHNENGCFTVTDFTARGEIGYLRLDDISLLDSYIVSSYTEKLKNMISIFEYEPDIWQKHKIKLFFGGYKMELKVLAEVIQRQIDEHGEFFGIKVNK